MSKPTLFIHIGPGKTATTFLQKVVLEEVHSATTLVKPTVKIGGEAIRFGDLFGFSPKIWADPDIGVFSRLTRESRGQENLIISDEHVWGGVAVPQPWIPAEGKKIDSIVRMCRQANGRNEISLIADHLRELTKVATSQGFSGIKILAVTRRQDTTLASSYAQASNRVLGASQEGFEKWVRYLIQNPIGYYMGGGMKLDYAGWHTTIKNAIGQSNIFLLPFELLKDNKSTFIRRYLTKLGVGEAEVDRIESALDETGDRKQNVASVSATEWVIPPPIRSGPRLRPTRLWKALGFPARIPLRLPDLSRDQKISLSSDLSREILKPFKESNKNLASLVNSVDIKKYGYML